MTGGSDDDFAPDPELNVLPGHADPPIGGDSEVGQILLELITAVSRMRVLMSESDETEFNSYLPRLATFLKAVGDIPTKPKPNKTLGFRVEPKKAKRGRK